MTRLEFTAVFVSAVHTPLQLPEHYKTPYAHLSGDRKSYAEMTAAMNEAVSTHVRVMYSGSSLT